MELGKKIVLMKFYKNERKGQLYYGGWAHKINFFILLEFSKIYAFNIVAIFFCNL